MRTAKVNNFIAPTGTNKNKNLQWIQAGLTKRLFGFVAGRTLKPKIPGPVVFVAPYNLKPNCTIAVSYPWVGFEISPKNLVLTGGGADRGFSLKKLA
jgi:hypothetical protein